VIYDLPNFAGGVFSFWNRSAIPLTQAGVLLKGPFSLLPNLRANKFEGQASFVNPGLVLLGAGVDVEVTPSLKAVAIANHVRFHRTEPVETVLYQPQIRHGLGLDLGLGAIWRPWLNENVVITGGISGFVPGGGFRDIYRSSCTTDVCGAESRDLFSSFVLVRVQY
jgi:hypothetical protein